MLQSVTDISIIFIPIELQLIRAHKGDSRLRALDLWKWNQLVKHTSRPCGAHAPIWLKVAKYTTRRRRAGPLDLQNTFNAFTFVIIRFTKLADRENCIFTINKQNRGNQVQKSIILGAFFWHWKCLFISVAWSENLIVFLFKDLF